MMVSVIQRMDTAILEHLIASEPGKLNGDNESVHERRFKRIHMTLTCNQGMPNPLQPRCLLLEEGEGLELGPSLRWESMMCRSANAVEAQMEHQCF